MSAGRFNGARTSRRHESCHGFRMIEVEMTATAGHDGSGRSHGCSSGNGPGRSAPMTHLDGTSELMTQVHNA
jgi:hypothetical protein